MGDNSYKTKIKTKTKIGIALDSWKKEKSSQWIQKLIRLLYIWIPYLSVFIFYASFFLVLIPVPTPLSGKYNANTQEYK